MSDRAKVALATLLRISEPASPPLLRHLRAVGVEQTLADVRAGAAVPDVDVPALQHRLAAASGERDLAVAAAAGARLVAPGDDEWPLSLDDLAWRGVDCLGLWVRGPGSLGRACERSVAVVGTRAATDYGVHVTSTIAGDLAEAGWTIVSGLAYGIDGAAHRAALAVGGHTVAVLASGVDVAYPKAHRTLYDRLAAEGHVVSEHPPGAAPQRPRFLVRNRIIAALSLGTVVVEMAARSGARSTALHAAGINRHVMCVPGPVTSPTSVGCHQLLREHPQAVLVTRATEVAEQVGHMGELAEPVRGPATIRDHLGPTVAKVLEGVPVRRSAPAEAIALVAGVATPVALASLAALRVAGLVEETDGRWAMTTEGRRDRGARRDGLAEPLPFDSW